jgi:hypothetical protein
MKVFKVAAIAAGGLGLTWAAQQVSGPLLGLDEPAREVRVAQAEPDAAPETVTEPAPEPAGGAADAPATTDIEQLSDEDIAEELARIEAASAGQDPDELEEFTPSRPLAADLAISLPSDI